MAKKSYKGFIIWTIAFLAVSMGSLFLPVADGRLLTRIYLAICALSVTILTLMVYVNGRVYWYNGVDYDEAVSAGVERCKVYAFRHFVRFGICTIIYMVFTAAMHILNVGILADILMFGAVFLAAAVSTIKIKL